MAKIYDNGNYSNAILVSFFPYPSNALTIPASVPDDIRAEFREAEICAGFGASRASLAMFRSTLEKALKATGYTEGKLKDKINQAVQDGVLTEPRGQRAHNEIRIVGNDVLHDEWRIVENSELDSAHRYTHRILEDLYDDRSAVEQILIARGRMLKAEGAAEISTVK